MATWKDFVKQAVEFRNGGFVLGRGESPWVAAREHRRLNPGSTLTAAQIMSANPGVGQGRYREGRLYRLPSAQASPASPAAPSRPNNVQAQTGATRNGGARGAGAAPVARTDGRPYPFRLNNPGNMEYSANNPWPGQIARGGVGGRFARYDTPMHGLEAAIGRWMEIIRSRASRGEQTRIPDVVRVYSPGADGNDERQHSSNIASRSGNVSTNDVLDVDNVGQMADLALGIAGAESGPRAQGFFAPHDATNAVINVNPVVIDRLAR